MIEEETIASKYENITITDILYDKSFLREPLKKQQIHTPPSKLHIMSDLLFEVASATNYSQKCKDIFHKHTRSVVSWQSTDYAVTPIDVLFKLEELSFVTQIYMHPKLYKSIKTMEIFVSDSLMGFQSIAKVYDFTDGVRIQISKKCKYLKFTVLDKQHGRPASIDFLRIYGHQYFRSAQMSPLHSTKKQKVEKLFIQLGIPEQQKWQVDADTLITLHDMSKLKTQYLQRSNQKFKKLQSDTKTVLELGTKIKKLQTELRWVQAKRMYEKIKEIKDYIRVLEKSRDFFDEKYQTTRFEDMIGMDQGNNLHDRILRDLLEDDRKKMEEERKRREEEERERQRQIDEQFQRLRQQQQWWRKQNELDNLQPQHSSNPKKTPRSVHQSPPPQQDQQQKYKFNNPYVYNQGDADMQKHIKPLLSDFGPGFLSDPQLLRRYQQMELLDILGARIWVAAHSENWRHRAAAVQAVLNFSQDKLPERYGNGQTKNLFLALMEFARITAQDKVLQIYYLSLKIMTVALAPPICGDDVPPTLINKSIQKFLNILIQKISEMNQRAKQISLKTMIAIFNHPVADITIAINQCLKVCREELNTKFVPVEKQNPRIVESRLEIVSKIIQELPKDKVKKIQFDAVLKLLIQGGIYHSHNDVRTLAVKALELIHGEYPQGTIEWYKSLSGLKPNIKDQIQSKLKIK